MDLRFDLQHKPVISLQGGDIKHLHLCLPRGQKGDMDLKG